LRKYALNIVVKFNNLVMKEKTYYQLYREKNRERIDQKKKEWYLANKSYCNNKSNNYNKQNSQKISLYQKEYRFKNKEDIKEYRKKTVKRKLALNAKRRASLLQQTPKWANLKEIEEFYKNCPKGYHVDHVIPLKGKNVRGLHTLDNLQYLPAKENLRKYNKV